jgi:hypothetical protein
LPANTKKIADDIYSATRPELQRSYTRWGKGTLTTTDAAHQTMLQEFSNRSAQVRAHLISQYKLAKQVVVTLNVMPAGAGVVKISTITPDQYPWSGTYFDGVPVTIEAVPNAGYTFDTWNANNIIQNLKSARFTNNMNATTTFTANFKTAENSSSVGHFGE